MRGGQGPRLSVCLLRKRVLAVPHLSLPKLGSLAKSLRLVVVRAVVGTSIGLGDVIIPMIGDVIIPMTFALVAFALFTAASAAASAASAASMLHAADLATARDPAAPPPPCAP